LNAAGQIAVHDGSDLGEFVHHADELFGIEGLRPVGERLFGLVVNLDHDAVGTDSNAGAGHGQDLVSLACAVAGINEDGEVAEPLHGGDDAEVERVSGVVGEGAYAALTEGDIVVALAHDVFGGHEEFVEGGAEAALEQDRFALLAGALQQGEVLHVARADLDDVSVLGDEFERLVVDGLGDDAHAKGAANVGHDEEGFEAESLEGVGRGARLECAAAEELCTGSGDLFCDAEGLFAALDGAGPGDDGEISAADGGVCTGEGDDGVFVLDVAAGEFVSLGDPDDFGDAAEGLKVSAINFALVSGNSDGRTLRARQRMRTKSELLNVLADRLNFFRRRLRFHHDKHDQAPKQLSVKAGAGKGNGAAAETQLNGRLEWVCGFPRRPGFGERLFSKWLSNFSVAIMACSDLRPAAPRNLSILAWAAKTRKAAWTGGLIHWVRLDGRRQKPTLF